MAKSRKTRQKKPGQTRSGRAIPVPAKSGRFTVSALLTPKAFVIGIFLLAGAIVVPSWLASDASEGAFDRLALAGRGSLGQVMSHRNLGAAHVAQGRTVLYPSRFPTSGNHWPRPLSPGFYTSAQRSEMLVHSLEHGNVVIYYETLDAGAEESLREWAKLFTAAWSGVIVVPKPGLGKAIVLTAWTRSLRLDRFEPKAMAAFVDAFRGRGPEHPVR